MDDAESNDGDESLLIDGGGNMVGRSQKRAELFYTPNFLKLVEIKTDLHDRTLA